ncbi:MAG: serine/threonine protein kinase [Phycisphaeraceae bacterium]|nr:serine/threonine protein kinase [Phycisphaeraceae bacterium]
MDEAPIPLEDTPPNRKADLGSGVDPTLIAPANAREVETDPTSAPSSEKRDAGLEPTAVSASGAHPEALDATIVSRSPGEVTRRPPEPGEGVPQSPRFSDPVIGRTIGGVEITELVGEGGMGRVYSGSFGDPPRKVAVKFLSRGFNNPEAVGRFQREVAILDRLRHPGIAEIVAHGLWDDGSGGIPYMVIEFVEDAKPLAEFAQARRLDQRGRLELFHRACEAIAFAHEMKILHRDLKPANLLVDRHGRVKVIDFGVARGANGDLGIEGVRTETGQLIGTVQYMSPEQIAGDPRLIDLSTDVYALGVILYEMLAEAYPYDVRGVALHEAARIISAATIEPPRSIDPTIDETLNAIVMRCLDRDRTRRFAHAGEVAAALERYLAGPSSAMNLTAGEAVRQAAQSNAPHAEPWNSGSLPSTAEDAIDLDRPLTTASTRAVASSRTRPGTQSSTRMRTPRGPARGAGGGSARRGWGLVVGLAAAAALAGAVSLGFVDLQQVRKWLPGIVGGTASPATAEASLEFAPTESTSTESLTIVSAPEGALVTIDGQSKGRTPLSLMITWTPASMRKTVEVTAPGYEGAAAIVIPDPAGRRAEPLRLAFNLAPRGPARDSSLDRLLPLIVEGGAVEVRVEGASPRRLDSGRREVPLSFQRSGDGWSARQVTFIAPGRVIDAFGQRGVERLEVSLEALRISDQPEVIRLMPR